MEFYAALKGDIKSLLMKAIVKQRSDAYLNKLLALCNQATLTPKEARDRVVSAYARPDAQSRSPEGSIDQPVWQSDDINSVASAPRCDPALTPFDTGLKVSRRRKIREI